MTNHFSTWRRAMFGGLELAMWHYNSLHLRREVLVY